MFSCPLGLSVAVSLAFSSDIAVILGFPVFLVRVAWSVRVTGEPFCCGACGGLPCVGGLFACVSRVSSSLVLSCRVPSLWRVSRRALVRFARVFGDRLCSAAASFDRSLLPCVPGRLALGPWGSRVLARRVSPVGSGRFGVSLPLPVRDWLRAA